MYGRLITFMAAVLLGLAGVAFLLNWLWVKAFGPGIAAPQQSQVDVAEAKKQLREENAARQAARRESDRHSERALATAAHSGVPKPLSADEFDPQSGTIHWPELLQDARFRESRQKAERLAKCLASSRDSATLAAMRSAVDDLHSSLKAEIRELPPNDYIGAQKFLESLAHWARE